MRRQRTGDVLLKGLLAEAGISQAALARMIVRPDGGTYSKTTICHALSGSGEPARDNAFRRKILAAVKEIPEVLALIEARGIEVPAIWRTAETINMRGRVSGVGARLWKKRKRPALALGLRGDDEKGREIVYLKTEARKHFKVFASPFGQPIFRDGKFAGFMSPEHAFVYELMRDAASNCGLVAITGPIGSGKTTFMRKFFADVEDDTKVEIITTHVVDRERIDDTTITTAIISDLSGGKVRQMRESRARQMRELLRDRAEDGVKVCLVIDDAQDLTDGALLLLKKYREINIGKHAPLGVILVGQPELASVLKHPGLRALARRTTVAEIEGLGESLGAYLEHQCRAAGAEPKAIYAPDVPMALAERMSEKGEGRRRISTAYPLDVNNNMTRAMNLAAEMGYPCVSAAIIAAL